MPVDYSASDIGLPILFTAGMATYLLSVAYEIVLQAPLYLWLATIGAMFSITATFIAALTVRSSKRVGVRVEQNDRKRNNG